MEIAKGKADEVAEVVGAQKAKVEVAAAAANEEAAKTAVVADAASTMQADCERDLAAAIPAVEKAEAALNNLDKKLPVLARSSPLSGRLLLHPKDGFLERNSQIQKPLHRQLRQSILCQNHLTAQRYHGRVEAISEDRA